MLNRNPALHKVAKGVSSCFKAFENRAPCLQLVSISSSSSPAVASSSPSSSSVGHSQTAPGLFSQIKLNWGALGWSSSEQSHSTPGHAPSNRTEGNVLNVKESVQPQGQPEACGTKSGTIEGDEDFKESLQGVFGVVNKISSASEKNIVQLLVELGSQFPRSLSVLQFIRSSQKDELNDTHAHLKNLHSRCIGQVSANSALNIIKAMALLRYSPTEGVIKALCAPIQKDLHLLDFPGMVDFVQAMALLGKRPESAVLNSVCTFAMETIEKSLKRNLRELEEVVHLLEALGSLGHIHEGFLNVAGDCLRDRIKVLPEESLAKSLQGFAKLGFYHELFLDDIVHECVNRQPKNFSPSQLASILHSLSHLKHDEIMSEIFVDVSAQCAVRRIEKFTPGEVADLIWSYTRLFRYKSDVKMLDTLTRSLVGKVHELQGSPDQLVNLVEAVTDSDLGACPEQTKLILTSVEEMTCTDIANMSPSNISRMLLAFSKARHYSSRLFSGGLKVLASAQNELDAQELVRALHSCGAMVHNPDGKDLAMWVKQIIENKGTLTAGEVSRVVWSLAVLESLTPDVFEELCKCLGDGSAPIVQVPDIKRLVHSEMLLGIKCQSEGVLAPRLPEPLRSYMVPAWRERMYLNHSISSFQQEVGLLLMKLSVPFELEKLVEEGDCRIDFDLTSKETKKKVAVECDGPRRFSSNSPFKALGDTIAIRRILEGRGWNLLSISKHEWQNLSTMGAKEVHLRNLLHSML